MSPERCTDSVPQVCYGRSPSHSPGHRRRSPDAALPAGHTDGQWLPAPRSHDSAGGPDASRDAPARDHLSLSRLWYAVPPTKGGTTDGQYTVHRWAGSPLRISGFDKLDARGVSTVSP